MTVAPKQSRTAGTHATAWRSVPVGTERITLRGFQDQADLDDASLMITFVIEGSSDGGVTPFLLFSGQWSGGVPGRNGTTHPAIQSVSIESNTTSMRLSAVLPRTMSIGLEAEAEAP